MNGKSSYDGKRIFQGKKVLLTLIETKTEYKELKEEYRGKTGRTVSEERSEVFPMICSFNTQSLNHKGEKVH